MVLNLKPLHFNHFKLKIPSVRLHLLNLGLHIRGSVKIMVEWLIKFIVSYQLKLLRQLVVYQKSLLQIRFLELTVSSPLAAPGFPSTRSPDLHECYKRIHYSLQRGWNTNLLHIPITSLNPLGKKWQKLFQYYIYSVFYFLYVVCFIEGAKKGK